MTDNEIIKALEYCKDCSANLNFDIINLITLKNAKLLELTDLINRQQAEIERLQSESIGKCELAISMRNDNNLDINCNYCINKSKAEAIKEYREKASIKLAQNARSDYWHWIDDVLYEVEKELVGEE